MRADSRDRLSNGPFERRHMLRKTVSLALLIAAQAAVPGRPASMQTRPASGTVLYEGARLIAGDGSAPIAVPAFLVENGTITRLARRAT